MSFRPGDLVVVRDFNCVMTVGWGRCNSNTNPSISAMLRTDVALVVATTAKYAPRAECMVLVHGRFGCVYATDLQLA
jgi:hypothetical protein